MVITRIGPVSFAKIAGTLYLILGFIIGAVVSAVAMAGGFASRAGAGAGGIGMVMGAASIIIFPLLYGCFGFVASLIAAWLYNVLAGLVGGIEIETQ